MASTSRNHATANLGRAIKKDLKLATLNIFSLASIIKTTNNLT